MVVKKKAKKKDEPLFAKETWHILLGLAFLVVVFFVLTSVFSKMGTFEHDELTFVEEKFGELDVYRYTYFFESLRGNVIKYNLFLRVDPRTNTVPVEGIIDLPPKSHSVFVSIDTTNMVQCSDNGVGISSLAAFLTNNEFKVKGATPYEAEAELRELEFADCDSHPEDAVIIVKTGEESRIDHVRETCWVLQAAHCEILEVVEKFEVESIVQAKAREA
jgi:hypothetical protein